MSVKTVLSDATLLLVNMMCLAEDTKSSTITEASKVFRLKTLDGESVNIEPSGSRCNSCLFPWDIMSARAAVWHAAFENGG